MTHPREAILRDALRAGLSLCVPPHTELKRVGHGFEVTWVLDTVYTKAYFDDKEIEENLLDDEDPGPRMLLYVRLRCENALCSLLDRLHDDLLAPGKPPVKKEFVDNDGQKPPGKHKLGE